MLKYRLLIVLLCLCALLPACSPKAPDAAASEETAASTAGAEAIDAGAPPIPKGYATEDDVKAALMSGNEKLISRDPAVPASIEYIPNVEYFNVDGQSLQLDLYVPKHLQKPTPTLVFIHGGGWSGGKRQDYKVYNVDFAKRGYVTATISYRLSGVAPYPAGVKDVKCAIKFLRANADKYHIDPDRMLAIGGSAGGYMSMMIGYSAGEAIFQEGPEGVSDGVKAIVNLYGPCDLTTDNARVHGSVTSFLAKSYTEAPEVFSEASPITWLNAGDTPTLIFQGTIDSTVTPDQSDKLAAKLKELNIPYVYEKYEGWPHTMDLAQPVYNRTTFVIDKFMKKYVGEPTPPPAA